MDRFKKEQAGIKTKQKKIVELIETQFYAEWHKRNVFQIPNNDTFKKNLERHSQKNKRTEKSITTDNPKPNLTVSANPRQIRNQFLTKKSVMKEERKLGAIQPNIESIKNLTFTDQSHVTIALKTQVESRGLFKPLNLRIRNVNMGMGNR